MGAAELVSPAAVLNVTNANEHKTAKNRLCIAAKGARWRLVVRELLYLCMRFKTKVFAIAFF